jgi:type I restriction enzyme S subunit
MHVLHTLDLPELDTSTAIPGLNRNDVYDQKIPLPPLNEQKRIVAKVEDLLAQVNATKERLAKASIILKRFRQAVLAAACSGRLTADWREKHPGLESVKALLENLQNRRLQQAKTPSQKQTVDEIYSSQEEGDSDSLPESWKYLALDKLCQSFQYGTSKKSAPSGKVAVLRMGNIQNGEIDWNDLVYTSDDEEIKKYKLNPGDVLFNRTNSPELVGKTGIYRGKKSAIFAGYLIRINYFKELDSRYLNFALNTIYAKDFCMNVKTDGVSQSNINAQKLAKFEIPFCPIEEQQEIVRRVEAMFKLAGEVEKRVAGATVRAEKLTQAILSKAFRGELIPTEAELARRECRPYEPASVLLARIKSERESKGRLESLSWSKGRQKRIR